MSNTNPVRGDAHVTSTLRWGGDGMGDKKWQKWDVTGRRRWRVSECSGRPIFVFLLKTLDFHHDQILCWAKQYIIDNKSSFWLWRQIVKPSFNNTIALFVG